MPAPTYPDTISGKFLSAYIDDELVTGNQKWDATETADQLDGTTGADLGYENDDDGISRVEATLDLVQNLADGPALTVSRGTVMSLQLYRSDGDTLPAFDIPVFKVYSVGTVAEVKGRITQTVRGRSKGPYTVNAPGA